MTYLILLLLFVIFILNCTDKLEDNNKYKLEGDQFNTHLGYSYLDSCYSKFYNNYEDIHNFQ